MYATSWKHPTFTHYKPGTKNKKVVTPCCKRKERSENVYDLRMVPRERRPNVYGVADFYCQHCINHAVLNLRQMSYAQLARDMGAPEQYIESAAKLDAGIEANR